MPIIIEVVEKNEKTHEISIKKEPTSIGRSKSADLTLGDTMVSGKHCQFFLHENQLTFKDLGSTNGSYINDLKIIDAHLYIDDELKIGTTIIKIKKQGLTKRELLQHTRSSPKTKLTYISYNHTVNDLIQKSDLFETDEAVIDPKSLRNKQATTLFTVEKRKSQIKKQRVRKIKAKKQSFLRRLLKKFKI